MNDKINMFDTNFWKGNNIQLRAIIESDWLARREESYDTISQRLVNCQIEIPRTDEYEKEVINSWIKNQKSNFIPLTIINNKNEVVGGINLNSINKINGTFSIAIIIYKKSRRKGYALESTKILLKYAFYELRMQKCNSACLLINEPSKSLHKVIGFKEEGLRRRNVYMDGQFFDEQLYGLTIEEFKGSS